MSDVWIGILATVLFGLMGVVWAMLNGKIKKIDECKVDKSYFIPTLKAVDEKLDGLKDSQKEHGNMLMAIRISLAGLNKKADANADNNVKQNEELEKKT